MCFEGEQCKSPCDSEACLIHNVKREENEKSIHTEGDDVNFDLETSCGPSSQMDKSCFSEVAKHDESFSIMDPGLTNECADHAEDTPMGTLGKNPETYQNPEIRVANHRKRKNIVDPSTENSTAESFLEHFGNPSSPSFSKGVHEKKLNLRTLSTAATDKLLEEATGGSSTIEQANVNECITVTCVEAGACDTELLCERFQDNSADNDESASTISVTKHTNECVDCPNKSSQSSCLEDSAKNANACISPSMERPIAQGSLRKLLVLDINGLLADLVPFEHVHDRYQVDAIISGKAVFKRPHCDDFLLFCFERFDVGVWSSRTKRNVDPVVNYLMSKTRHRLLFCWNQSHCTNTGFPIVGRKRDKPIILKKLKKLWEKQEPDLPWEIGDFDESNTLLLDDSPEKALCNPPNTAIFPFSYVYTNGKDDSLGPDGDLRVYLERLCKAENVQKYVAENPFGQRAITERNLSWPYYVKVIKAATTSSEEEEEEKEEDVAKSIDSQMANS